MNDIIVGTAGHIDHGKTTLLKALTGIDADRLDEEKRRGISIDIGFAHMNLEPYRVGFIDVPGHEKFVKNMLVGIGGIQLVLLVVAADESVMPQTVEHFQICKLLQIPRGIIVITKKHLVDAELLSLVEVETRELVKGSRLESSPVVAVDSVSGEGLDELKTTLLDEIRMVSGMGSRLGSPNHVFRLPIDRVFTIRGFGTIVTGTPYAGSLKKGQEVTVYPADKEAKVRGIEIFNEMTDSARAGQRAALNLSGLQKEELGRGMTVSATNTLSPSHMLDAVVHLLGGSPGPLKQRGAIRFHHGSAELIGRIYLLEGGEIRPGESQLAQLRLESPVVCCPKDCFILRRYSPVTTIGGGVVLDGIPEKHRRKDLSQVIGELDNLRSTLQQEDSRFDAVLVEYFIRSKGALGISLSELVSRTGFLPSYLLDLVGERESLVLIHQDPARAVFGPALQELEERMVGFLSEFHVGNPLSPGTPQEELKERFLKRSSGPYFQFVLDRLKEQKKIQIDAGTVSLFGQEITLTREQQELRSGILRVFEERALQPPTLDQVVGKLAQKPDRVRDVYYFLLKNGDLVRINENLVLSDQSVAFLKKELKRCFSSGKTFTVPEFKDLFKISRKYAIPFLEFLDRQRFTRRVGDKRVVL